MRPLDLHSERYSATGNIEAHGARNQLGRPRLDQLTVLIREAFQNSWDARLKSAGGVEAAVALWTATVAQKALLSQVVFANTPPKVDFATLFGGDVRLLAVSDRGTHGLGGPTRADVIADDGEPTDFVDLLRNLGQPPDKPLGGGTFGYGKAALYAPSAVNTIIAYTRAHFRGKRTSRLIGASLGTGFQIRQGPQTGRYTGRHWWGRQQADDIAEPLIDAEADDLARALGLPPFRADETGTTILVVGFLPGAERNSEDAVRVMKSAILWNFWPKMVADDAGGLPMRFTMTHEGKPVEVPRPEHVSPFKLFARALQLARRRQALASTEALVTEVVSKSPKKSLGWLALVKGLREPRAEDLVSESAVGGFDARSSSHVACMRQAELVVKYVEGAPIELAMLEYGGVFVGGGDPEVDRAFALAEPPTHDDWVDRNLEQQRQRYLVRSALRAIDEHVEQFARPQSARRDETSHAPLGRLSSMLGNILVGLEGPGGEAAPVQQERTGSGPTIIEEPDFVNDAPPEDSYGASWGGRRSPDADQEPAGGSVEPQGESRRPGRPRVRIAHPRLAVEDGEVPVLQLDVEIQHGIRTRGTRLRVAAHVILDGDEQEHEPPAGAAVPIPWRWRGPAGQLIEQPGPEVELGPEDAGRWTLSVRLIDDAEVKVAVAGEALL